MSNKLKFGLPKGSLQAGEEALIGMQHLLSFHFSLPSNWRRPTFIDYPSWPIP
jgi:hypothetical protein